MAQDMQESSKILIRVNQIRCVVDEIRSSSPTLDFATDEFIEEEFLGLIYRFRRKSSFAYDILSKEKFLWACVSYDINFIVYNDE